MPVVSNESGRYVLLAAGARPPSGNSRICCSETFSDFGYKDVMLRRLTASASRDTHGLTSAHVESRRPHPGLCALEDVQRSVVIPVQPKTTVGAGVHSDPKRFWGPGTAP